MDMFRRLDIAASGLSAQRAWMDLISGNIANAQTTSTPEGGPFRRQLAVFQELLGPSGESRGVRIARLERDDAEFKKVYNPGHPDADAAGYVLMPNVDVVIEMVDLISAQRAYEANATVIESAKSGFMRSLSMLQA